jgi:uncharacterized OB-fold protein
MNAFKEGNDIIERNMGPAQSGPYDREKAQKIMDEKFQKGKELEIKIRGLCPNCAKRYYPKSKF